MLETSRRQREKLVFDALVGVRVEKCDCVWRSVSRVHAEDRRLLLDQPLHELNEHLVRGADWRAAAVLRDRRRHAHGDVVRVHQVVRGFLNDAETRTKENTCT